MSAGYRGRAPWSAIAGRSGGPLITLAAADSLDYLLYPSVPIIIADAVFYEATRDSAKLGAQSIIDWVKAHRAHVEIAITNTDRVRSIPFGSSNQTRSFNSSGCLSRSRKRLSTAGNGITSPRS